MERSEKQAGWLKKLNRRMQGTGDSEPEQAKLRSSIAVILVTYICFPWHADETLAQTITSHASIVLLSWTMLGFVVLAAIALNPVPSQPRRIFGAILDMGSLSLLFYFGGAEVEQ